jgi:hypothetical protein
MKKLKIIKIVQNNTILLPKLIIFKNSIDFAIFQYETGLWTFENFVQVDALKRSKFGFFLVKNMLISRARHSFIIIQNDENGMKMMKMMKKMKMMKMMKMMKKRWKMKSVLPLVNLK